jgi:hypothetical protein
MGTSASLLAALALAQAAPAPAEDHAAALSRAFAGWYTEVEDDLGDADSRVTGVATDGCVTMITGEKGRWRVDWRTVEAVALEDVFVFLAGPGLKIAVVADVRDEAGLAKLRGMHAAMRGLAAGCRGR